MSAIFQFVLKYGYALLFGAIFAHQIGVPLPGPLFLVAAGALAANGKLALPAVIVLAVIATVLADWPWYEVGRLKGVKVLHFLHRLTRDPELHDRRAMETFARCGPSILLISKFVPGLDAVAPPLTGISRTSRIRFFTFDVMGAALYSFAYAGLGYVFSHDLNRAATYASRAGSLFIALGVLAVAFYVIRKLFRRSLRMRVFENNQFIRLNLENPSMSPAELSKD